MASERPIASLDGRVFRVPDSGGGAATTETIFRYAEDGRPDHDDVGRWNDPKGVPRLTSHGQPGDTRPATASDRPNRRVSESLELRPTTDR